MLQAQQVESLIRVVASMDRDALIERLLDFHGSFPVDFTPDYLHRLSADRLRHIFVAICLQAGQLPVEPVADAA